MQIIFVRRTAAYELKKLTKFVKLSRQIETDKQQQHFIYVETYA